MPLFDLHGNLSFEPPAGDALVVEALGVRLDEHGVALRVRIDAATWARVYAQQLFGAHPAVLPTDAPALAPDQPVTLVLDLHPALAASALAEDDPLGRLSKGFGSPWDAVRLSEHWRLRAAAQPVALPDEMAAAGAELEAGFSTAYASDDGPGTPDIPLATAIDAALRAHGLEPVPFNESTVRARVSDEVGDWTLVVLMDPEQGLCTVYSAFPRPMAAELRPYAADALVQINAQLAIGALELDEDGQLRVRTGVDLGGPAPGTRVLERTIGHNLALMREAWETFAGLAPA